MTFRRRVLTLSIALGAGALGIAGTSMPAHAQDKPYSVYLTPESSAPGPSKTFEALITNHSKQTLGSANLTAPRPITVATASLSNKGVAAVPEEGDGKLVTLRNLELEPGKQVTLTMTGAADCGESFLWSVAAKQANDFNGTGNDLTLVSDERTNLITAVQCELTSTSECGEESVNTAELVADESQSGCKLRLVYHGTTGFTYNPTVSGVGYTLTYEVVALPVVSSNAGTLNIKLFSESVIDCSPLSERVPVVGQSTFIPDLTSAASPRKKLITWRIDYAKTDWDPVRPAPAGLCFRAPNPFLTSQPEPGQFPAADGQFTGVMSDCIVRNVSPCTYKRQAVDVDTDVIQAEVPAGLPDPYYRG